MNQKAEQTQAATAAPITENAADNLLDDILNKTRIARSDVERTRAKDLISELITEALNGTVTVSKDVISAIEARMADIDNALSDQLNAVMHAPEFQQLEGTWRGMRYLVMNSETNTQLKIRVINVTKQDLIKNFDDASDFDQSAIFKKIYGEEYDMFGGAPYAAIVGDFEFSRHPEDIRLLEEMSHVAAAAHAPFLTAASAELFNLDSFAELPDPRDIAKIFDTEEYIKWKSFRESEDSRYVGLVLPHVLGRLPYGANNEKIEAFNFEEDVSGKEHNKYLWMNAAYVLGTRLTDAFARYGWCTAIRGVKSGGLVEGLPTHTFTTDEGEIALKCPTEVAIGGRREKELSDCGFITLVHCKGTDKAAFFAAQSAQKVKKYNTHAANANARLSAQLPYILAVSRFAHYMKAILQDDVGGSTTRDELEKRMNRWIMNYVTEDDAASFAVKAEYPLREARIDVVEVEGKPGVYKAVAFMRPHFLLDELTIAMRLVAELPSPAPR
ncbi:MAG: type VI secretion system contractile sheath large subunit [Nitrosomonas sp.]|nr:type VI secretion system contractile sheath large subunit [Nitrosomonas sp.]